MKFIEEERAKIGQEGRVRKGEKRGEKEGGDMHTRADLRQQHY